MILSVLLSLMGFTQCGRYRSFTMREIHDVREMLEEINKKWPDAPLIEDDDPFEGTGDSLSGDERDIAPRSMNKVITKNGLRAMYWGFVVPFSKTPLLHAMSESVETKPTWREPLQTDRIIIATKGFYEYTHDAKKRPIDQYFFTDPNNDKLYLAGISKVCAMPDGKEVECYAVITVPSNDSVSHVHDRMPLALDQSELGDWLYNPLFIKTALSRVQPHYNSVCTKKKSDGKKKADGQIGIF